MAASAAENEWTRSMARPRERRRVRDFVDDEADAALVVGSGEDLDELRASAPGGLQRKARDRCETVRLTGEEAHHGAAGAARRDHWDHALQLLFEYPLRAGDA